MIARSFNAGSEGNRRAGFTLLEVLLTSLLAAIILVNLWSLSDIYLRLFASGKRKIEEVQVVRGLTQQLANDVAQVVPIQPRQPNMGLPPASVAQALQPVRGSVARVSGRGSASPMASVNLPTPPLDVTSAPGATMRSRSAIDSTPPGTSSPAQAERKSDLGTPKFGLFGSKQALRLIVLRADPLAFKEPDDLSQALPEPGQPRTPLAPELRTIQYSFRRPHEASAIDGQHPPGLIRREWPWEIWSGLRMANPLSANISTSAAMMPPETPEWTPEDDIAFEKGRDILHLSQVTAIEFRYFDGENWDIEWNSWERQRLPNLIEVLFTVKAMPKEDKSPLKTNEVEEPEEPVALAPQKVAGSSAPQAERNDKVYRRLIYLPSLDTDSSKELPDRNPSPVPSTVPSNMMGARRP